MTEPVQLRAVEHGGERREREVGDAPDSLLLAGAVPAAGIEQVLHVPSVRFDACWLLPSTRPVSISSSRSAVVHAPKVHNPPTQVPPPPPFCTAQSLLLLQVRVVPVAVWQLPQYTPCVEH